MKKLFLLSVLAIALPFKAYSALVYNSTAYRFVQNWPSDNLFDIDNDGVDDILLRGSVDFGANTVQLQSYGTAQGTNAFALMDYGQEVNSLTSYLASGQQMLGNLVSGPNCTSPGAPNPCYQPGYPNVSKLFIGIKFYISGQLHYGWIELSSPSSSGMGPVPENWNGINKIVYDDVPNTPVTVGTITTSTITKSDNQFNVYPIPTKDLINIASEFKINSIELYNSSGTKVDIYYGMSTLSLAALPKGMYTLVIKSEDNIVSKCIIKE